MNFRSLLKLSTLAFFFTLVVSSFSLGQTVGYLNSTDGDDSYDGSSATHSTPTVGPKRTLTGAFAFFATGTTVYMTAGDYKYDQSGIGGGNDAAGYTLGTGANKSMTFIVQTYNSNSVANLATGPLVINNGTGTIAFQAATAGVQSVSFGGASITLTTGTLDVSAITFAGGAGLANIFVTEGAFVGTPTYSNTAMTVTYNGTTSKTAGAEMPAKLASLVLSNTASSTITFPNAITFGTTGGGIINTAASTSATFNGLVTLTSAVGFVTAKIVNNQTSANWSFAGGVTVSSSLDPNGIVISNSASGKVLVTGALNFNQLDATGISNTSHHSTVQNTGSGTLGLTGGVLEATIDGTAGGYTGKYTVKVTPLVTFTNAAGTANLGGGTSTTITDAFTTTGAGTVNLTGSVSVGGIFTNIVGSTIAVGANNLTLNTGTITNNGTISGAGTVIFTTGVTVIGTGSMPNVQSNSTSTLGAVTLPALTVGNVSNTSSGLFSLAATSAGNISDTGSGNITLTAAGTVGAVSISGSGILNTNTTVITGTTTVSAGGITLGGNTTMMGAYTQNGGALNFATFLLDVKGTFTRNTGSVTPGTGTLQFSAGGAQVFSGGTNLEVYNFSVTGVGTGVSFVNGSLMVDNNATIVSNTNVILGTYNIRMEGTGGLTPTFANSGQYTSVGGGGIIFEGPAGGNQFTITGNGINSNIEIRLASELGTVQVPAAQIVTWSGLLTLTRGTIDAFGAGSQLNPSTVLTTPTIQRNLGDANSDGNPDGRPIKLTAGVFNYTNTGYNLSYYSLNPMIAITNVGPEFVAGANARVINFSVTATPFAVNFPAGGPYKFSGNLVVGNSSIVNLAGTLGTDDLVSTGTGVIDLIQGTVQGTAQLSLQGDGTVNGGTQQTTAPVDAAALGNVSVNTSTTLALYNINSLKTISSLSVVAGTANLDMQVWGSPAVTGTVTTIAVSGGSLILTGNANLGGACGLSGGTFDFGNFNLTGSVAPAVTQTGGTFADTKATTGGYLIYGANGTLTGATIPRVQINSGIVLTLGGSSKVTDIFSDYNSVGAGTLTVGANTLTISGGTWNAKGTYTAGAGEVLIAGATNVNLGASISVPNLELKNTTNIAALVNGTGTTTSPKITVTGLFTSTSGTLNLNACDIVLTGAAPLKFVAGTFTATNSNAITAGDNDNGEFVFNNAGAQTISVTATGLVLPNVDVAGAGTVTLAGTPNNKAFTISTRLVLDAAGGGVTVATAGLLTLGDGAIVVRMNNAGVLDKVPTFAGAIDLQYKAAAIIATDKEMPASVRNLYVSNATGIHVNAVAAVTVTGTLYLQTGVYDVENVATKIFPITMGSGATVNVQDGGIVNGASATLTQLAGGPINLIYSNSIVGGRTTTVQEFPTAITVSSLTVLSDDQAASGASTFLALDASRTVGTFTLNTGGVLATKLSSNYAFDLNKYTLTVASATLTRGVLLGSVAATPATLTSAGAVTSTANTTINNVNVTGASLALAGGFVNTVGVIVTTATVTGTSTIGAFSGNLISTGPITINGTQSGTITASSDVTVAAGGAFTAGSNLAFVGTSNATLTVPAAGATIGSLTIKKASNTATVTLSKGNLTTTGTTFFVNGLLVTGANTFYIFVPPFGSGQGFDRSGVTGTNISHVVGNVAKTLKNAGGPGLAGSSEPRQEFPVGNLTTYKPVAISFNPVGSIPTTPNATFLVGYVDGNPGGASALPIKDGVAAGIDIARYPAFYWNISSMPTSIGPTTPFDLELTAAGLSGFDAIDNVRIIRRYGTVSDVSNDWLLQGLNSAYDNSINGTVPTIIVRGANAGLRLGGAVFTVGMKSNMKIKTGIPKQWLVLSAGYKAYNLGNVFTGNLGTLSYVAQSSNTAVATVSITGTSLNIVPVATGDAIVTVTAIDAADNDFFAYSFPVNIGLTDVQATEDLPKDFALYQNYPNPFNPTTNIKFDLPKESNVTLKVYNILGEEVTTLVNKVMSAGHQVVSFDASKLASGMYIYRIQAGTFTQVKKMLLMK